MQTLSLVIPVYNEEKTLRSLVFEVIDKLKNAEVNLEIVLVDDCSTDKSYEIALRIAKETQIVKVFKHQKNMGKGAALKTGFKSATGDFIGIQDADMEYNPEDYLKMLAPLLSGRADVVYGSRYLARDKRRVLYFWHTFMNRVLTLLTNMYTNLDITDMETCYKLFRRDVIKEIAPKLKENRFGFEPEVTVHIAKGKYRLYECAVNYNPRTYDEGKKIGAKDGLRALYCIFHYGAHTAPLPMQFILYILIGGISALVNILLFTFLNAFQFSLLYSVWAAFIISAVVNYFLCIALLFRHKAMWSTCGEVVSYILTLIIMGFFDYACTFWFIAAGFAGFWAKSLSSLIGLIGNFLLRKYFVFKEKRHSS